LNCPLISLFILYTLGDTGYSAFFKISNGVFIYNESTLRL